uniref:Secreted salivary protein n=1 Tax=Culicoides nubeculosus TaxID=144565 RepID=B9URI3_CULNU|nr:secreted salivary protein [Culicoides nubeculosus]
MKIPSFIITLFLVICITNVCAQRRLEKIYDAMECPPRSSGTYKKVCNFLQNFYIKSPDKKLGSYLKSGVQEAGNRIMRTVSQSDKVTLQIVKGCLLNFQVTINKLNEEAIRKHRSCKNGCFVEAGRQFVRSLDNDAVERARCIMGSI